MHEETDPVVISKVFLIEVKSIIENIFLSLKRKGIIKGFRPIMIFLCRRWMRFLIGIH